MVSDGSPVKTLITILTGIKEGRKNNGIVCFEGEPGQSKLLIHKVNQKTIIVSLFSHPHGFYLSYWKEKGKEKSLFEIAPFHHYDHLFSFECTLRELCRELYKAINTFMQSDVAKKHYGYWGANFYKNNLNILLSV